MPAVSKAQQRLMGAAEHGATFPAAEKIRASMSHQQMHDFAAGSEKGKPDHVQHHVTKAISHALGLAHHLTKLRNAGHLKGTTAQKHGY